MLAILWVVSAKVIAVGMRWLGAVAAITAMVRRAGVASARWLRAAQPSSEGWALPPVGQQLVEPAVQLRRHPREDVLDVGPRVVSIELGRLQQAHHDRGAFAGQLTSNEEPILLVMRTFA